MSTPHESDDHDPVTPRATQSEPGARHAAPLSPPKVTQKILNEDWPLRDRAGHHARGIADQVNSIDVDVRLVLSEDGEAWVPGRAQRWIRTHVYVTSLTDQRLREHAVWVIAGDVRRR